jgi:hypothetical protein
LVPAWLHVLSLVSLLVAAGCALTIAFDESRHPQKMWIMNLVWPLCALFGSLAWLWGYFRFGRLNARDAPTEAKEGKPFPVSVGEGASHCGSGCTLGDICAEWLAFGVPALAVWFGYGWLFGDKIFAVWVLDFIFAFAFGIVFQYFAIAPMRDLGVRDGLVAALKADTLSLTAWQVGMYGFMAVAHFWIFAHLLDARLQVNSVEFWFMMQIAMLFGFATSYPVNWWLIRSGIKEAM